MPIIVCGELIPHRRGLMQRAVPLVQTAFIWNNPAREKTARYGRFSLVETLEECYNSPVVIPVRQRKGDAKKKYDKKKGTGKENEEICM